MLFAGLWHGSIKSDMDLFMKPLAESLQSLSTEGTYVHNVYNICISIDHFDFYPG